MKTEKARLDADRTAEPKSSITGRHMPKSIVWRAGRERIVIEYNNGDISIFLSDAEVVLIKDYDKNRIKI